MTRALAELDPETEALDATEDQLALLHKLVTKACPGRDVEIVYRGAFRVRVTAECPGQASTIYCTLNESTSPGVWARSIVKQILG